MCYWRALCLLSGQWGDKIFFMKTGMVLLKIVAVSMLFVSFIVVLGAAGSYYKNSDRSWGDIVVSMIMLLVGECFVIGCAFMVLS
jgi:hypothetical protein